MIIIEYSEMVKAKNLSFKNTASLENSTSIMIKHFMGRAMFKKKQLGYFFLILSFLMLYW